MNENLYWVYDGGVLVNSVYWGRILDCTYATTQRRAFSNLRWRFINRNGMPRCTKVEFTKKRLSMHDDPKIVMGKDITTYQQYDQPIVIEPKYEQLQLEFDYS